MRYTHSAATLPAASLPAAIFLGATLLVTPIACENRRTTGGDGGVPQDSEFFLKALFYGRSIDEGRGLEIVSPLTLVRTHPLTGLAIPGSLEPLADNVDPHRLLPFELGPEYTPLVVPRNGVLVLEFSAEVDPASVVADRFAPPEPGSPGSTPPQGPEEVLEEGSVQVRDAEGRGVPVTLTVISNVVVIDARGEAPGFPPSPLVYDAAGEPLADPAGYLGIILPREGDPVLRGKDGSPLAGRPDGLGDPKTPIGFNPGNSALDFIQVNDLLPSSERFNGFLPDRLSPRVIRLHELEGTLSFAAGDFATENSIFIHDASFDVKANHGFGEWARAQLVIREGKVREEKHVIHIHSAQLLTIIGTFDLLPRDGDTWRLVRPEYFEPDPEHPIDPEIYDPFDPENPNNSTLENFVVFTEIDATGTIADANGDGRTEYRADELIPSRSLVTLRFDEGIDPDSLAPYESLRVTPNPFPETEGLETVGAVTTQEACRVAVFWPMREDPSGENEFAGLGPDDQSWRVLVIRTAPESDFLAHHLSAEEHIAFRKKGYRVLSDLAGHPLAFAERDFDREKILIEYDLPFQVTTIEDETYRDLGAVAHLFQGVPRTGRDPETGDAGVRFYDKEGLYGPHIADINLLTPGNLQGAPVTFERRVLDDQPGNRPPEGPFDAWPNGVSAPIGDTWHYDGLHYGSIYGVRFQHVYRVGDCSISPRGDLAGSLFDLFRVAFAPIGGHVTHDVYEDISIHAAHSTVVPDTTASLGNPNNQFSGLGPAFDTATWQDPSKPCGSAPQPHGNYIDPLEVVVPPGTPWTLDEGTLEALPGTPHVYHPWPEFSTRYPYDNARSLVLEYRIRPQETTVSFENGFTFAAAIPSSPFPRFRAYSLGNANNTLVPDPEFDPYGDLRALCASGPLPKPQKFGDNSCYFYAFDYVKLTSVIRSPFVQCLGTSEPRWLAPIYDPPLSLQPWGTQVELELRAAEDPAIYADRPEEGWTTDLSELEGKDWIQFRVRLAGNPVTRLVPVLDTFVLPYERRDG
ncbi:MAG: hypothetical protein AB1486_33075 [Planctomycetota bacterium]